MKAYFPKETEIQTINGPKLIQNLKTNDVICLENENYTEVNSIINVGLKEVIEIEFTNNDKIQIGKNNPIILNNIVYKTTELKIINTPMPLYLNKKQTSLHHYAAGTLLGKPYLTGWAIQLLDPIFNNFNWEGGSNKFISDGYKYSSKDDRIELIQGLMDEAGSYAKNIAFRTSSKNLCKDFKWIIESLGGIGNYKSWQIKDQQMIYECSILFNDCSKLFTKTIKINKILKSWKPKEVIRKTKKIKNLGLKECFEITHKNKSGKILIDHCIPITCQV